MDQTFALYRILGNDLPPRHGTRQTANSLRFILDHEPDFPGCEKRWIVNRIADADREAEVIGLLTERGQKFLHIPFDLAEYGRRFLDADGLPGVFNAMEAASGRFPQGKRALGLLAFEWVHRWKNLYAFNLNATRNLAIEDGFQTGATWVMPWDGQCFLTRSGFSEILEAAANNPDARYLLVPIARFTDNHVVLRPDFTIKAVEEPQVIFRRDARDRFDERLRYANMNKAEFLIRIGLPGDWNRWPRTPWEAQYPSASDAGKYAYAGWVARLASETSRNVDETGRGREVGRYAGIAVHCAGLDARLIEAARAKSALNCYQPFLADLAPGRAAAMALVRVAEDRLATAPSGLADAVAGDDHTRQRNAIDSVTVLAIAAEFTRKVVYAEHAAALARRWLIGGGAGVNPRLDLAEGVVDFRDVWALCDALTLLERRGMLTEADSAGLKAWFEPVRAQLAKWGGAFGRMDAVGVFHDLAVASAAAYCGDTAALAGVLARAPLRLHRQIEPGGWLPGEAAGTRPLHRALFALQGLIALAWLGRNCGIDLWRYAGAGHRSIPMAANFIAANRAMFSDYAADRARFDDRIEMALRAIPDDAADVEAIAAIPRRSIADPRRLGAADGFAPLWPILLATEEENARSVKALELPVA